MLSEVKLALRLTTEVYDDELLRLISSGIIDLQMVGANFDVTEVTEDSVVTDYTITDSLVVTALITYVKLHFGAPANYDKLKASYDEQKAQMRETSAYSAWEE